MLKPILTTILLGTSTIAMADTPYPDKPYTDRRGGQYRQRPVTLAQNVVLNPRTLRPTWIPIDGRIDVSRLRLRLDAGRAFINTVTFVYSDGYRSTTPVRQLISWRDPTITVDVPFTDVGPFAVDPTRPTYRGHRTLQGIFIDNAPTRSARGGGYRRNQSATIDVIGLRR